MLHERILVTRSCGHVVTCEQICTSCVIYLEESACDECREDILPGNKDCELVASGAETQPCV